MLQGSPVNRTGGPGARMSENLQKFELHAAVLVSDYDAMRASLGRGAPINLWDDLGMTPLLYAIFRGDTEAVELLLSAGADPNRSQQKDPSATPLWHASQDFGLDQIAELLLRFGARL